MENGILKKSLLSLKRIDLKGAERIFEETIAYKHYILGFLFNLPEKMNYCTIINTQDETVTSVTIELGPINRNSSSICYWKDNIFVLYGGEAQPKEGGGGLFDPPPQPKDYDVHYLQIIEKDAGISIQTQSYHYNNPQWWNTHHSAYIYQDNMYILGGKQIRNSNEIWKFNLKENMWSKLETTGQAPTFSIYPGPGGVCFGNKIYLLGASFRTFDNKHVMMTKPNDLYALEIETMMWKKVHEDTLPPFHNFENLKVEALDQKIFVSSPTFEEFIIYDLVNKKLEHSQDVSPKVGFIIKSCGDHSILFRLVISPYSSDRWIEFHTFSKKMLGDDVSSSNEQNESEQSVTIRKTILPQASHMQLLWKDKLFADVTFVVQNEEILAHRNILIKSHYFLTMFQSGLMESNSAKIPVTDISPLNFKTILEFIYFGKISLKEQLATDLIVLADKYLLSDLKADCESYLLTCVNITNFLDLQKVAETVEAQKLEDKVASFLITNLEKVSEEVDPHLIPQELLLKAMKKMKSNQK